MIRKDLIDLYFTNRDRNDRAFFLAEGGNGNQEERRERRGTDEIPLLEKMTDEEIEVLCSDPRARKLDIMIAYNIKNR